MPRSGYSSAIIFLDEIQILLMRFEIARNERAERYHCQPFLTCEFQPRGRQFSSDSLTLQSFGNTCMHKHDGAWPQPVCEHSGLAVGGQFELTCGLIVPHQTF